MKLEKPLDQMTADEIEELGYKLLRDAKDFYGNWKEVRKIIDMLEENDEEAHFERSQNKQ